MKYVEHKRRTLVTEFRSRHWSVNGKREAKVLLSDLGYLVEMYEKSRLIHTVELFDKSEQYAEDAAENWALGIIK